MLDFDSEGINCMEYDVGEDSESMGYRIPSSSHDIYMVDTPKEDDGDNPEEHVIMFIAIDEMMMSCQPPSAHRQKH